MPLIFGCVKYIIAKIKVRVFDVFGKAHTLEAEIPSVTLEEARNYNPSFGKTHSQMSGKTLPFDEAI